MLALSIMSAVVLVLSLLISMTRQLHMLQQNSYFNGRYIEWLTSAVSGRTFFSLMTTPFILLFCMLFEFGWLLAAAIIFMVIRLLSAFLDQKNAIKPLVFTARVKRMYFTAAILASIYPVITFLDGNETKIKVMLTVMSAVVVISPFVTMLVNIINSPIEILIKQWYIWDAKKILKSKKDIIVVGITGSYGKTSTKYILSRLLEEKYNVTMTPGNFNTQMGVVRTIREHFKSSADVFVVEMGAKCVGDIKEICDIVKPDVGIVTSVGPQHLNTFKSIGNILSTKLELADAVIAKGGKVFLNGSNDLLADEQGNFPAEFYGDIYGSCCHAENICSTKQGTAFEIVFPDRRFEVTTKLLGAHNVLNIIGAVSVASYLGVSDKDIRFAIANLTPVEHRLEMKPFINNSILIDDAYNANPSGSIEAMKVIGSFDGMKKIVVTPGLVELGEREYDCNYKLGEAAAQNADIVILVGKKRAVPLAEAVNADKSFDQRNLHIVSSFKDAMDLLRTIVDSNCVVIFENDLPDNYAG